MKAYEKELAFKKKEEDSKKMRKLEYAMKEYEKR